MIHLDVELTGPAEEALKYLARRRGEPHSVALGRVLLTAHRLALAADRARAEYNRKAALAVEAAPPPEFF